MDKVNLLQLQVDNIVHHTHCHLDMFGKLVVVERSLGGKWLIDIAVKVQRQQAAAVVGAQRNLATRVGRNGAETLVGIAVGDTLAQHSVPEQATRLGTLPRIVDNLLPQSCCVNLSLKQWLIRVDGELLYILLATLNAAHKLVIDLNRHVSTSHLTLNSLGIDKFLGIGVFDRKGKHQSTTAAILSHLASRVRVALHKGNDTGRGQSTIQHWGTSGAEV